MKKRKITEEEINKITGKCQPREKAFFTLMRQSGLPPRTIKQLRIQNIEKILEPDPPIPCRINVSHDKFPVFVGEETVTHLKEYLLTKKTLTQQSLLFTPRNKPNKEINTKDMSRAFKKAAQEARIGYEMRKREPSELTLFSLVDFYREKAKHYLAELSNNTAKDDEFYRKQYEDKAMPYLEIEIPTPIQIQQLKRQNKEFNERFKKLEEKFPIPQEPPPEYWQQVEQEFTEHERYRRWLKEHPEEEKRLKEQQEKFAKEYDKYLEEHPEIIEQEEELYRHYLETELEGIQKQMREIQAIVRKPRKTRRKT